MENKKNVRDIDNPFERIKERKITARAEYHYSLWNDIKKEFLDNKIALLFLVVLSIIIVASLLAPLSPYDPNEINSGEILQGVSKKHWFGTDEYGRDYFTRALYGGRISLLVGVCAMIVTVFIGTAIGVLAGYLGGKLDTVLMRCTDIFLAIPTMLLMIVLSALLRPGLPTLILVLSVFAWPSVARITRAETLSLKERDFVIASRNLGANSLEIAVKHILPNIMGSVIVAASLNVANAILMESTLSFMGLGVQIPQASWGSMLENAQSYIFNAPHLMAFPGILILLTVLSFNLLGDVLRSALEPKSVK